MPPQPEPISRTRCPGLRSSFAAMRCFCATAPLPAYPTAIGRRRKNTACRIEKEVVERARQIVMMGDIAMGAAQRVELARPLVQRRADAIHCQWAGRIRCRDCAPPNRENRRRHPSRRSHDRPCRLSPSAICGFNKKLTRHSLIMQAHDNRDRTFVSDFVNTAVRASRIANRPLRITLPSMLRTAWPLSPATSANALKTKQWARTVPSAGIGQAGGNAARRSTTSSWLGLTSPALRSGQIRPMTSRHDPHYRRHIHPTIANLRKASCAHPAPGAKTSTSSRRRFSCASTCAGRPICPTM